MTRQSENAEARVADLVDCDNTTPEILEYALSVVAQFGRVVLRRGYGNHATLANKWQDALVKRAFTPCLQYQYAAGKNTADIALALDAMEAMFDLRAESFCLVTSDSDFAHLCRKLRERGATVHIVGESKTPDALRNASDQFFEWVPQSGPTDRSKKETVASKAVPKRRPKALINAVSLLVADTPDGRVGLGALGQYLKRTDPGFSPKAFGHSALSDMVRTYPDLALADGNGSGYWVSLKPKARPPAADKASASNRCPCLLSVTYALRIMRRAYASERLLPLRLSEVFRLQSDSPVPSCTAIAPSAARPRAQAVTPLTSAAMRAR